MCLFTQVIGDHIFYLLVKGKRFQTFYSPRTNGSRLDDNRSTLDNIDDNIRSKNLVLQVTVCSLPLPISDYFHLILKLIPEINLIGHFEFTLVDALYNYINIKIIIKIKIEFLYNKYQNHFLQK